jgi:hypothetical protein
MLRVFDFSGYLLMLRWLVPWGFGWQSLREFNDEFLMKNSVS